MQSWEEALLSGPISVELHHVRAARPPCSLGPYAFDLDRFGQLAVCTAPLGDAHERYVHRGGLASETLGGRSGHRWSGYAMTGSRLSSTKTFRRPTGQFLHLIK